MEAVTLTVRDKQYTLAFPSLRRVKRLGILAGVEIFKSGLAKCDWSFLEDEAKTKEVLSVVLTKEPDDSMLDEVTPEDVRFFATTFFLTAKLVSVTMTGEFKDLPDSTNARTKESLRLLMDLPSTPPSIPSPTATPS